MQADSGTGTHPSKPRVAGSSPAGRASFGSLGSPAPRLAYFAPSASIRGRDLRRGFTSTTPLSRRPSPRRRGKPASPREEVHTPSGIRLRHILLEDGSTFGRCRSCSGTPTSAQRWCTRTFSTGGRWVCAAPSIGCERVAFGLAAKNGQPPARRDSRERREIVAAQ